MAIATTSSASSPWTTAASRAAGRRRRRRGIRCSASRSLTEQYRTLQIHPGASEKEVKKAFRRLALQYHPDVCKGRDCGVQFHRINEAYDIVMSNLRAEAEAEVEEDECVVDDSSWEMWEEWMGWEGAGIRDYSSHINPYI